ncbi:LTA synthase family protein [Erythrobacter mangrovi]|uniref:LTA synthase family protein n=1 Tax=Erythrobacter mangrovi TaxID=2739433 RepID=A0A7D3Y167_9SPHN|nr:LTA synthase family protein [Erythrobacter mangrovi]QKG72292.1 LTA synthase family protein [Erythrobacter mangrovi]
MSGIWYDLAIVTPLVGMLAIVADAFAAPRGPRSLGPRSHHGTIVLLLAAMLAFGVVLFLTGAPLVSGAVVATLLAALSLISNVKRRVLGEPLVFSDFALIGAVFQHPQFYLTALRPTQVVMLGGGVAGLLAALALLSSSDLAPRFAGLALGLGSWGGLAMLLRRIGWPAPQSVPDPGADVMQHGLVACLLGHWHAWRGTIDPEPCDVPTIPGRSGQLVVIVQCESFTDPAVLFDDTSLVASGLDTARKLSWQHGRLLVSGFGAYTMRTEFGVLFGRGEEALGTRRFDPFLTAHRETSWALPNRLDRSAWDTCMVHPHDMRFYGRHRLMPRAGFDRLVGEEAFAPPGPGEGRYVTDAAVADRIIAIANDSPRAGFVYAVTIENHGPWPPDKTDATRSAAPYLKLLANSDAMLTRLLEALPRLGRPTTLCFFGDHRPSIPGASEPGAERHTPYVMVRFDSDGTPIQGSGAERDLTPAELHHTILDAIRLGEAER